MGDCEDVDQKKKETGLSISYKKVGRLEGEVTDRTRTSLSGTLR